ncbi:unnamed protein product [marine sediment metagenome]|uniref:Uncharacterized protein n=1 Tax=marine sediment metagenome TaxID=412755 RepID=X1LDV5_9ZZZZ
MSNIPKSLYTNKTQPHNKQQHKPQKMPLSPQLKNAINPLPVEHKIAGKEDPQNSYHQQVKEFLHYCPKIIESFNFLELTRLYIYWDDKRLALVKRLKDRTSIYTVMRGELVLYSIEEVVSLLKAEMEKRQLLNNEKEGK